MTAAISAGHSPETSRKLAPVLFFNAIYLFVEYCLRCFKIPNSTYLVLHTTRQCISTSEGLECHDWLSLAQGDAKEVPFKKRSLHPAGVSNTQISERYTHWAAVGLFVYFGAKLLLEDRTFRPTMTCKDVEAGSDLELTHEWQQCLFNFCYYIINWRQWRLCRCFEVVVARGYRLSLNQISEG